MISRICTHNSSISQGRSVKLRHDAQHVKTTARGSHMLQFESISTAAAVDRMSQRSLQRCAALRMRCEIR